VRVLGPWSVAGKGTVLLKLECAHKIFDHLIKIQILASYWWLTPVILATQEDRDSKPVWANSSTDPISKKPFTK
jgi:hypothetical protein